MPLSAASPYRFAIVDPHFESTAISSDCRWLRRSAVSYRGGVGGCCLRDYAAILAMRFHQSIETSSCGGDMPGMYKQIFDCSAAVSIELILQQHCRGRSGTYGLIKNFVTVVDVEIGLIGEPPGDSGPRIPLFGSSSAIMMIESPIMSPST